jgi:hypothetical protein
MAQAYHGTHCRMVVNTDEASVPGARVRRLSSRDNFDEEQRTSCVALYYC